MLILLPIVANAYDFEIDGFCYTVLSKDNKTCQIDGTTSSIHTEGDLVIPSTVTHNDTVFSVIAVRDYAFYRSSSKQGYIQSVTIPEGVKLIGRGAFAFQSQLDYISLPNSIERIEESAFGRCPLLKMRKLIMPKNLKYLGYGAFGEDMYNTKDSIVTLIIQEQLDSIDAFAFSAMHNLQKVIILTSKAPTTFDTSDRGYGPFYKPGNPILYSSWSNGYWQGLYGEKCEYINNYFEEDGIIYMPTSISPLTCDVIDCNYSQEISSSITIPKEVTHLGVKFCVNNIRASAFKSNDYITEVFCHNNGRIDESAFANCKSLISVSLGDEISHIGSSIFEGCSKLEQVVLGQAIKSISDNAFSGCENLANITYKGSIKEIGSSAFSGCYNLTSFNLPEDLEQIGYSVFLNCKKLNNISIPNTVTRIESLAFSGCESLSEIEIPNNVRHIGQSVFEGCVNLENVKIGNGITSLGYIFKGCSSLKSIELGNNIKSIGESTFENLTSLQTIIIPKSVESIGNKAFSGCSALKEITFEESEVTLLLGYNKSDVFEIGKSTFSDCPLENISLGRNLSYESSFNYGYSPFFNLSSLKSVTIKNTVVTIPENLFRGCNNIKDVYCFSKQIPNTGENVFTDSGYENATLHVFSSLIDDYKQKEPWKNFKSIIKISLPKHVLIYMIDNEVYKSYEIEEEEIITPEPAPEKEGYTFSGWSEIPVTMPAHDVTVTGTFSINSYKLTYMIDDNVYKETVYEYGALINPEPQPEGDYATFEWRDLPQTMPAHDVVVYASYTSGIMNIQITTQKNIKIYTPSGKRIKSLQRGINIIVLENGKTKKVDVK